MAAWVVAALAALILLKPQEFVPFLSGLPLVYIAFGAALVAIFFDVVAKRARPAFAPAMFFVVAMMGWGVVTVAVKRPDQLGTQLVLALILLAVYFSISIGAASSKGLKVFVGVWLACALAVSVVAIVQGFRPRGCMVAAPDDWEGKGELSYDGRPCETIWNCKENAPDPNLNYRCERPGPWSTSTVGDRVRYRGSLADPNELSLMTALSIPLAIAFFARERRKRQPSLSKKASKIVLPTLVTDRFLDRIAGMFRAIPSGVFVSLVGLVVVLSKSRGGLLVFLLVLAIQFVRKAGAWGVVMGCLAAPPMLLIGGRSGTEAEESADERVGLLREAIEFFRNSKGFGIGLGQFPDESSIGLTAHNAYALAAAEMGVVGLVLFGLVLYSSIKIPVAVWFSEGTFSPWTKRFAAGLSIALAGAYVGIFFLSWTVKDVLYMVLAGSAALYGAARAEDPSFRVKVSAKEIAAVTAAMLGLLAFVYVVTRVHK